MHKLDHIETQAEDTLYRHHNEEEHLVAVDSGGWGGGLRKELKKLVLKQIPSWSLCVLSVPL